MRSGTRPGSFGEGDEGAAGLLARAIRKHWLVVLAAIAIAIAGCLLALSQRDETYEASAQVLVVPLPGYDRSFLGLDVIRDSGDPARTLQTAATLLKSPEAAQVAAGRLADGATASDLLGSVLVQPQGESNVLAVTARASDPVVAARRANEFTRAALAVRRDSLLEQLQARVREGRTRRAALAEDDFEGRKLLTEELSTFQAVLSQRRDPTLTLAQEAAAPGASTGAPPWLLLALAIVGGCVVGAGAAMLLEALNRRVRDEDELMSLYPLPVLARVPPVPRQLRGSHGVSPFDLPPAAREAFRSLKTQIEGAGEAGQQVMVTSASAGDGKTTAACSLAVALADAGHQVILADLDVRRPGVASVLRLPQGRPMVSLLRGNGVLLEDLLTSVPDAPGLRILQATDADGAHLETLLRSLPEILGDLRTMADFVVVDTPPVGEVSDALGVARHVDQVVLVGRPRHTHRANLEVARDLLERSGARLAGYVLTGQTVTGRSDYYAYGSQAERGADAAAPRLVRSTRG